MVIEYSLFVTGKKIPVVGGDLRLSYVKQFVSTIYVDWCVDECRSV